MLREQSDCLAAFSVAEATRNRSPGVNSAAFRALSPNLRFASLKDMDFAVRCPLVRCLRLVFGFCPSTHAFARCYLQTPGSARQAFCWLHEYNLDLPLKQTNGDTARRSLRTRSTAAPMPMVRQLWWRGKHRGREREDPSQGAEPTAGAEAQHPRGLCELGEVRGDLHNGQQQRPHRSASRRAQAW
ncbi:hypothetical protein ACVWXN_007346 [Bradyrhizobium sp. i1.4.4]